jgi:peptide/nickel transport system ATP-binding protein
MSEPLLTIEDLRVAFHRPDGMAMHAVDGIDLKVQRGRTLGIVGESGCGKSVTSLAIMGLLPKGAADITGHIRFEGNDLATIPDRTLRDLRGDRIAMTSLNPSYTIGNQIAEAILRHRNVTKEEARRQTIDMLKRVRIPSAEERYDEYPHKLSGGMRQRVMIAMALACTPDLLIADEPTTALDVTIQAQILELMRRLKDESGTAIILITHDLGVVAEMCDDVAVMYAGQVVERAPCTQLFEQPQHPYTIGLLGSLPRLDGSRERLAAVEGLVPDMTRPPKGCRFASRCPFAEQACLEAVPPLAEVAPDHFTRCRRAPLERLVA